MRPRPPSRRWLLGSVAVALMLGGIAAASLKLFEPLPLGDASKVSRLVLDRNGRILRAFTTPDGRWRFNVRPEDVSPAYLSLLLAFEDHRFWKHHGVDPLAVGRAAFQMIRHGRAVSGGSTLTMQVARLLRGSPTHSIWAKLQQVADAIRLEAALSKSDILSLYLKLAPYGGNLEGVRAASLAYFGKEPKHLTIAEAALLVAIPQSPETRRPDRGTEAGNNEKSSSMPLLVARNRVIRRALAAGVIKRAEATFAMAQPVPHKRREFPSLAAHLSERLLAETVASASDLTTTIDKDIQEAAETITRRHAIALGEKISIAAIIVNHRTGEVLAHVGSAGYFDESRLGAIDMTAAIRSPGSALKPFIYGLAFEEGLAHPETLIEDRPARFDSYAPTNFDSAFHGTVTIRQALQLSLNVPAVKVLYEVGPARLSARFRDAGMPFTVPRNLTVALGGIGLTLENLTTLYAALARGGSMLPLEYRIEEARKGAAPPSDNTEKAAVLQPIAAWYVTDILRGAPTPSNSTPGAIAFKTGTSYGFRDAWAAGFDGEHTIAVWAGRADASSVPGLVGLRAAAPVLFELFSMLGPHRAPFAPAPPNIIGVRKTADLPPPLRFFREQKRDTSPALAKSEPPHIAFPPPNSEVELASAIGASQPLALKAEGGVLPLTWLVDGVPLQSSPHRRETFLQSPAPGFIQVTVVDANGQSDHAQIRLR